MDDLISRAAAIAWFFRPSVEIITYPWMVENRRVDSVKCCENCACYEVEWEYCFRSGAHTPKDGYCKNHREETSKEK